MVKKNKLMLELEAIRTQAHQALAEMQQETDLQAWHTKTFGRTSLIINIFSRLPELNTLTNSQPLNKKPCSNT
jgi:hypothetical protein